MWSIYVTVNVIMVMVIIYIPNFSKMFYLKFLVHFSEPFMLVFLKKSVGNMFKNCTRKFWESLNIMFKENKGHTVRRK